MAKLTSSIKESLGRKPIWLKSLFQKSGRDFSSRSHLKRIFVIDDDDDLRDVVTWSLLQDGFAVEGFKNPHHALLSLKRNYDLPDLILVDYHLQEMNGGEFLSYKSRADSPKVKNCPVIIITGSPYDVTENVADTLYTKLVPKPLSIPELIIEMNKILERGDSRKNPSENINAL